jgi:hypothetical protein
MGNIKNGKVKLAITLFVMGFLGILTMLCATIPIDDLPESLAKAPPFVIKLIVMINPTLMLAVAVIVGVILYDKVNLTVPAISALLKIQRAGISFAEQLKYGVLLGLLAGVLVSVFAILFNPIIPVEFSALADKIKFPLITRFIYGGVTEELLMRFGFMTFLVWLSSKITGKVNNTTFVIGIILSTLIFAVGHLPLVFITVPEPGFLLLTYIIIGNSIAGFIFAWLYWKKGLEAAMISHIFTHVVMNIFEIFIK